MITRSIVFRVSKAVTRLLRHDESVRRGSDGAIHCSDIIKECRKQKFDDVSQWPLGGLEIKTGRRRRTKEKVSILRESKLFQSIPCTFEQFKDIQEKMLLILRCKTTYCYRKDLPSTLCHVGNACGLDFYDEKWINSRRNKPQKRKTRGLLHYGEPDGGRIWHGWNSIQSYKTKDRSIQNYLETLSKYCISVQFEPRPRERSAILPDTVTCSRSLQHTACSLHWENGMYENTGWALPEGSLDSESATSRAKIELATGLRDPQNQNERSSWEPSSDSKSYGEICNNTVDHRISGVPLSAVEQ